MDKTELFLLRREKKIKLRDIAKHLDCSVSLLSRYENGKRGMSEEKIRKYKKFIINYKRK